MHVGGLKEVVCQSDLSSPLCDPTPLYDLVHSILKVKRHRKYIYSCEELKVGIDLIYAVTW